MGERDGTQRGLDVTGDIELAAMLPADGWKSWWPPIQIVAGHGTLVAWPLSGEGPYTKEKSVLFCHAGPTGYPKSTDKRCKQAHVETNSSVDCAGGLPWTRSSTSDEY